MKRRITAISVLILAMMLAACAPSSSGAPGSAASTPGLQATQAPSNGGAAGGGTGAASTATSGGTGAGSGAQTGGKTVELAFWHGQGQSQQPALNALIDQFNKSHSGIHVTPTFQGTYSDLYKKVTAAVAAGSPPDLAIAYQNDVANYIKSGAVIPLDDMMKDPQVGFSAQDMQDIFPSFIDHYPQDGNKVYSLSFMRSMEVMYFNADLLKAAGFDKPPANWDDFGKICAAVSKPPDVYCTELSPDASRFANWLWSRGGELLSPDGKSVAFDSQAGVDTMQQVADLFNKKQAIVIGKAFQDQTDFALGKVAFTFGSSAGLPYYKQAIDQGGKVKDWGIAPSPHTTPDPVVDVYGPSVTIFKTTTEKQKAAFTFLTWTMGKDPDAQWARDAGYFPARQSAKEALADYIQANPLYGEAYGWLQYGKTEPTPAAWNPIRTYLADALTAVANGKATPEGALKDAAQKANQALQAQ